MYEIKKILIFIVREYQKIENKSIIVKKKIIKVKNQKCAIYYIMEFNHTISLKKIYNL